MKGILYLCCLLCCATILRAQTCYQMAFTMHVNQKDIPVTALYFQHADDSGFIRIRYVDRLKNEDFIYQAEIQEVLIPKTDKEFHTDRAYMRTVNPQSWGSLEITKNMLPVFLFTKKNENYIEPEAVYYRNQNEDLVKDEQSNFSYRFLNESLLTQKLLSRYFFEDEEWMNLFLQNTSKGFSSAEKNMRIHLLLVADTTDPKIGKSCAMNIRYVESFYNELSRFIGCAITVRKVMGPNYSRDNVLSEIKLLQPKEQDILVFYFSGHGYRKNNEQFRFPYFDLRAHDGEDYLTQTMNLEQVQMALLKKEARLTLALSDCCNSYVGAENPIAAPPVKKKSFTLAWYEKNVRSLYLDPSKKSIMACAADSTQYAFMANAFGGLFSFSLNQALSAAVTKAVASPTWYSVLEAMRNETFRLSRRSDCSFRLGPGARCFQVPAYRIR